MSERGLTIEGLATMHAKFAPEQHRRDRPGRKRRSPRSVPENPGEPTAEARQADLLERETSPRPAKARAGPSTAVGT
jgi:hypothetical protein